MTPTTLLTAAEFAALPDAADGSLEELVRGRIVRTPAPTFRHGVVHCHVGAVLIEFARSAGLGRVTSRTGFVTETDPDTVRGPDVAFWSFARLPAEVVPDGYPDVSPDLVAEVASDWDRSELPAKAAEYLRAGVRAVWVVDPADRTVTAFTRPEVAVIVPADGTLTAPDILPGFSVPVAELFGDLPE